MSRAEGTEAKGDGVTEEGKSPSSEGRCARRWEPQPCVAIHILSMNQSVTALNQYQQTNGEEHAYVLVVRLQEHDDQRRNRQKCRLVDVMVWG